MKPALTITCSCGRVVSYALGYGKLSPYTGMRTAKILANLFRHFHEEHGTVKEEIEGP